MINPKDLLKDGSVSALGRVLKYSGTFFVVEKPLTVYKKCNLWRKNKHDLSVIVTHDLSVIVTLQIPPGALVYLTNYKCRASEAVVLSLSKGKTVHGMWDTDFTYKRGKWVTPDCQFSDRRETCTSGIHFFLNRREAERY